ncbi:MAG: PorT family protein [Bacteroidales bacterium]|nr:PorT family protein [Bacteroidales bacterium]MBO7143167.1 PorT family protein [Bacteroidales bacterium]
MRHLYILVLLILTTAAANAQHKGMRNLHDYNNKLCHFGFSVGINSMTFGITQCDDFYERTDIYGIEAKRYTGFHVGPVANLRLNRYFDFRVLFDLSFNQRDLVYYYYLEGSTTEMTNETISVNSTLLELPVQFKYRAERMHNVAPYLIAGGNLRYDLTAGKPKEGELSVKLNKIDPCIEWGGGFDFYLQYFKFSIELKYSKGIKNCLQYDDTKYTQAIKDMKSNAFIVSFHFEG